MTIEEIIAMLDAILGNPDATPEEMAAALQQVREGLAALAEAPAEGDPAADEQLAQLDAGLVEAVAAKVKELEQLMNKKTEQRAKAQAFIAETRAKLNESRRPANPLPLANGSEGKPRIESRGTKSRHYGKGEEAYKVGMFLQALGNGSNARQAERWLQDKGFEFRTLTSANEASAGLLVPEEMDNAIIKLREEYGVAPQLATNVNMGSDTWKTRKIVSGNTAYLINEGTAITTSDPSYRHISLNAKLWGARTQMYATLSEDAIINMADEVTEEHARAHAIKLDQAYFNGDGTSTYGGIVGLTYVHRKALEDGGGTWTNDTHKGYLGSVKVATGTTWSSITDDDISGLIAKVADYPGRTLQFTCTSTFYWEVLHILAMNAGGVTATETVNGVSRPVFYGFPVVFNNVMPTATATDQVPLLFGDYGQASYIGERRGITVETDKDISTQVEEVVTTTRWDALVHDYGNYTATAADRTRGAFAALVTQNS